ncbi:MAG: hypothetical protein REI93_10060, partial [Pedobacter sp.]|nr:hypothetical protein [Pedobacter sp.]
TGEKVINMTDFKLDVGTTSINHRSYLYYDPTSSDSQYFYAPRMERIDGHEPSLNELLGFIPQQKLLPIADTRSMVTTPNFYSRSFELNFKEGVTLGLPNSYYTVMGLRGWPNDSGGKAHELAFSNDTKSKLWIRSGFDSGWEGWRSFLISNESGNYGINTDSPTDKLDIRGGGINIGVKGDNQYVNVFGAWRTQGSASAGLWDEKMEGEDLAFHYYTGSTWNTYRLSLTPDGFASTGTMNVMGSGDNFIAGNVRIGTTVAHPERLSVNGRIRAHEIKVETANWPDYVFDDDYKNVPLPQLEQFIKLHKHLPDVPSAKVVAENGIELGEMNKLLLKKIEELTLHLIQKDKENIELKKRMDNLEQKLNQFMK